MNVCRYGMHYVVSDETDNAIASLPTYEIAEAFACLLNGGCIYLEYSSGTLWKIFSNSGAEPVCRPGEYLWDIVNVAYNFVDLHISRNGGILVITR